MPDDRLGRVCHQLHDWLTLNVVQDALEAGVRDENIYKLLLAIAYFAAYVFQFWVGIGLTAATLKMRGRAGLV